MTDRLAVVTGASGGIGQACVRALRTAGFRVIGVDLRAESDADEHVVVDLATTECGEEIAARLQGRPLRALVNNAAVGWNGSIEDTTAETWNAVLDTNLRGAFLVTRALAPYLRVGGGAVVNVSSVHAAATSAGVAAYAASKGGLVALTRAMAVEWGESGPRVNCVLPGAIDTEMLGAGLVRTGASVAELAARHPVRRVGTPDDVAAAVVFLLSEETGFMTGTSVVVDGGALAHLSTE